MEDQVTATGSQRPPLAGQTWDTAAYAANGRFVQTLATAVVEMLAPQREESILDVGCGDGALTAQLASAGARVTGVDTSEAMVAAARARGLRVDLHSAVDLPYRAEFDAVFSNAAMHWIPAEDQLAALAGIRRALKPGGRFVAEMGGHGNIAAIRTALQAVLGHYGVDAEKAAASCFPSPAHYRSLLEEAGFKVEKIGMFPRPTPFPGGADGMRIWLNTFRNGVLDKLMPLDRAEALDHTVELLRGILSDARGNWTGDYVRLRFQAIA